MKTKLTLSVDKELVKLAGEQAKREGTSISHLFSAFIQQKAAQATTPSLAAMIGSLKHYHIDDSKEALRARYAKKYLD